MVKTKIIIGIDCETEDTNFFTEYISKSINQPLKMRVFSIKNMKLRGNYNLKKI
jgi:hypothetical protein